MTRSFISGKKSHCRKRHKTKGPCLFLQKKKRASFTNKKLSIYCTHQYSTARYSLRICEESSRGGPGRLSSKVENLIVDQIELGKPDESGRRSPEIKEGSEFEITITQEDNKTFVRAISKDGNIEESEQLLSKINESLS